MKQDIWYCDECGEPFHSPSEGEVWAGFGYCKKCKDKDEKDS